MIDCERWIAIFEAEMLGDAPSPADAELATAHEASCSACASERAAWRAMAALPERREDASVNAATVDAVLRQAKPSNVRVLARRAGLGVLLAAAAAMLVFFVTRRHPATTASNDSLVGARVVALNGDVSVDGAPATEGMALHVGAKISSRGGSGCVMVEPAVRVCVDKGGEASISDLTLAHRIVEVTRGRVIASLEPQPPGSTFALSTRAGTVTAVGTAFSVDVDSDVVARVLHGVVVVRAGSEQRLSAHQRLTLGGGAPADMTDEEERRLDALLSLHDVQAVVAPSAAGTDVLSLPKAPAATVSAPALPVAPTQTAPEMLRAARDLRAHGKYAEAARAYQDLEAAYPTSSEALASLLSLGDLQLDSLGDAAGALRSFDAYLAGGGTQVQETRYRRIRALRALGRAADEGAAIDAFLGDYPASPEAAALRTRRADIGP